MTVLMKERLRVVILATMFWTCIGLLFSLPTLDQADWRAPLVESITLWWAWGLLTPAIIAADRRLPFSPEQPLPRLAIHLVLGIVATSIHFYLHRLLATLLGAISLTQLTHITMLAGALKHGMRWSMLVYCLIVGGWWAYASHQRYLDAQLRVARMERSYTQAHLQTLRLQLDPHFLFNTLNTISAQVQADPRQARRMIEHLGDLLRISLNPDSRNEIALDDELGFLKRYLAIQQIRFGDKLRVTLDVAPGLHNAAVPSMLLQPLVENAIRHGISRRASGGNIVVTVRLQSPLLVITVRDDGVGLPGKGLTAPKEGLGLRLTRERIAAFHPQGTTQLSIVHLDAGGVQVSLRFPLRAIRLTHELI